MQMPDIVTFVGENPKAHGVTERPDLTDRDVRVLVRSVGMNEAYQAMANGLNPSLVFTLRDASDYQGEKILKFRGKEYRVVRTYQAGRSVELTCEELTIDKGIMTEGNEDA